MSFRLALCIFSMFLDFEAVSNRLLSARTTSAKKPIVRKLLDQVASKSRLAIFMYKGIARCRDQR